MAETGQELQVSIIARQAASGWLQSSRFGELVTAAVISGHWTSRALSDSCTTGIGHSAELSQGQSRISGSMHVKSSFHGYELVLPPHCRP